MIEADIVSSVTSMLSVDSAGGLIGERRSSPGLLLALLGHHAMRRLRETHTRHDLSPRQFMLLALLADLGATGQRELGQAMETDPSVLVTLLNPLEERGLPLLRGKQRIVAAQIVRKVLPAFDESRGEVKPLLVMSGFDQKQEPARRQKGVDSP